MVHEIELSDEYDALLTFSGMGPNVILMNHLNEFKGSYAESFDRELLVKIKKAPAEDLAVLVAAGEAAIVAEQMAEETLVDEELGG